MSKKIQVELDGKQLTQTDFGEIEKNVLEYLQFIWSEINDSIDVLAKNGNFLKSEVCLAFVCADALSRFSEIILTGKEELSNRDRFKKWIADYVLSDSNDVYVKHKKDIGCDSAIVWELRNSFLHFYSLPEKFLVSLATFTPQTKKKFQKMVYKEHSENVLVVDPNKLLQAIRSGLLVQLKSLFDIIKSEDDDKKETYAKGIVRCYEIIRRSGAKYFPLERRI